MPEHRTDPTLGTVCLLATDRALRPHRWVKGTHTVEEDGSLCPFCPGHEEHTPPTIARWPAEGPWEVRAFANRYPALKVEGELTHRVEGPLHGAAGIGAHEVIVESPEHGVPLHTQPARMRASLHMAQARLQDLRQDTRLELFSWFRNVGPSAGASQPHPHSQILASAVVGGLHAQMAARASEHYDHTGRHLLLDVTHHERREGVRVVRDEGGVVTFAAWAPRFPLECWIVAEGARAQFEHATRDEVDAVADALTDLSRRLYGALGRPAWNVVLYTAPRGHDHGFTWHLRVRPRIVGMGGLEFLTGGAIVHVAPEEAAAVLRRDGRP